MKISTESGSTYEIDLDNKKWKRFKGENAEQIRTDDGEFIEIWVDTAGCLNLLCPPINPPYDRLVTSTPIVGIEE
jgi:hypothetical protein